MRKCCVGAEAQLTATRQASIRPRGACAMIICHWHLTAIRRENVARGIQRRGFPRRGRRKRPPAAARCHSYARAIRGELSDIALFFISRAPTSAISSQWNWIQTQFAPKAAAPAPRCSQPQLAVVVNRNTIPVLRIGLGLTPKKLSSDVPCKRLLESCTRL